MMIFKFRAGPIAELFPIVSLFAMALFLMGCVATALHNAAREGNIGKMTSLLDHGAEVNALSSAEYTPLHYAGHTKQTEAMKLLLVRGADINAVNDVGRTALHV